MLWNPGRERTSKAFALTASVAIAACAAAPDDARDAVIVLDESDVHVLGTTDAIATVIDLEVLPDGRVWVLNSLDPFFIAFDGGGDVVQVHGQAGGGPEEFGAPSALVLGGTGGELWTYDRERHVLVDISRPEAGRSEVPIPEEAIPRGSLAAGIGKALATGSPVRMLRIDDELVLSRMAPPIAAGVMGFWQAVWTADLVAFHPGSGSVRDLVRLGEVLGDPNRHFDLSGTSVPFPLWYRLWAVCGENEIRVYDRLRNELRTFTSAGEELEPTVLPPPRYTEVSAREFARATLPVAVVEAMGGAPGAEIPEPSPADSARMLEEIVAGLDAPPDHLANLLPRYLDFRCDEDGTLWLQPFDVAGDVVTGSGVWLRIAPDGAVQEVRFPQHFDPYRFTPERIWGVQRDEFDVASVAWIAAPRGR